MASLIESLYVPTHKDRLQGLAQKREYLKFSASGAATQLFPTAWTVPPDCLYVITQVGFSATPGGTQKVWNAALWFVNSGGASLALIAGHHWPDNFAAGSYNPTYFVQPVDFMLLPNEKIQPIAEFSAGVSTNYFDWYVMGFSVPRANVQR